MDTALTAAGVVDAADPTADPSRDVELGHNQRQQYQNTSRASLPLSHKRSFSTRSGRTRTTSGPSGLPAQSGPTAARISYDAPADTEQEEDDDNETPWGPQHPCYPHLNPHVPLTSPLYQSTRVVRIRRDWMVAGDLAPAFSTLYPEILDPALPEQPFRDLVQFINKRLLDAFSPWTVRNWFDAGMGLLTGWLWDDMGATGAKKKLSKLEEWIVRWNKEVGGAEGVKVIPLQRTAYLCLDIQIPDPQLGLADGYGTESAYMTDQSQTSRSYGTSLYSRPSVTDMRNDGGVDERPAMPPIPKKYLDQAAIVT